jgi:hypothetical protein
MPRPTADNEKKALFLVNRVLIVLTIAAILGGLLLNQWAITLLNARILCLSCIGLE